MNLIPNSQMCSPLVYVYIYVYRFSCEWFNMFALSRVCVCECVFLSISKHIFQGDRP